MRESPRTSGTINFRKHITAWRSVGMKIDRFEYLYQIMATEGFNTTVNSNVTIENWGYNYNGTIGGGGCKKRLLPRRGRVVPRRS